MKSLKILKIYKKKFFTRKINLHRFIKIYRVYYLFYGFSSFNFISVNYSITFD